MSLEYRVDLPGRPAKFSPLTYRRAPWKVRGVNALSGERSQEWRSAMNERLMLSNCLAGFAVGLFLHAIPASWWPRWLRDLVGKKE
jgi:hypothetical protein